jgi:hypothetical protein
VEDFFEVKIQVLNVMLFYFMEAKKKWSRVFPAVYTVSWKHSTHALCIYQTLAV